MTRLITSGETKALQTAALLAARYELDIEVRPATHEIDRSATGFVVAERHEQLADARFARPDRSAAGWETARAAQQRIEVALADVVAADAAELDGDIVVVGHGGVGTLLLCRLAGLPIDRRHDQLGQGHHWSYDLASRRVVHPWRPIDELAG